MMTLDMPTRRAFVGGAGASMVAGLVTMRGHPNTALAETIMLSRPIPSSGEALPVVGVGTWQTFDIGTDATELGARREVLDLLFAAGGRLINSSPMYGRAEAAVGTLLGQMKARDKAFIATKVWTSGEAAGIAQMTASSVKMAAPVIDLMQIHNLVDWRTQLKTLRGWKEKGTVRYIGITHYTTSAFDEVMAIMRAEKGIDFVQVPYSLAVREAEAKLLPLALERGIAVIPNRPFDGANMFARVKAKPLPEWVAALDAKSFGQIFLKYLIGHTAIACVIPGTAKADHMRDNLAAGLGRMPDEAQRRQIAQWWASV